MSARRVIAAMEKALSEKTIDLATRVTQDLQRATPKATGLAANSWTPSLTGRQEATPQDPDAAASRQAAGLAEIQGFRFRDGAAITIHNPQPYLTELNRGRSSQAEAGYIEATIEGAIRER